MSVVLLNITQQILFSCREGVNCAEMAMVCLTDFEEYAKEHLSKATWDYYAAGADECCTRDDNLLAYKRYVGKNKWHAHTAEGFWLI